MRRKRTGLSVAAGTALALALVLGGAPARAQEAAARAASEDAGDYGFIDRADALWDAIGDAPPDHSFAFENGEPWAWETRDGYTIVVEEAAAGMRSFYFEPGAQGPFLAVEPGRSFGYDQNGQLAMVYGPDGGALPRAAHAGFRRFADDLYERALRLRRAMRPERFTEVDTRAWIDASPLIFGFIQSWDEGKRRHPGWRRHRDGDWHARQLRRRLEQEQLRRRGLADQFRRWREGGFQGPPPGRWRKPAERRSDAGRPGRQGDGRWEPGSRPNRDGRIGRDGRPPRGVEPPRAPMPTQPPVRRGPDPAKVGLPELPIDAETQAPSPDARPDRGSRGGRGPRPAGDGDPAGADGASQPTRERTGPRWPRPEGARPDWQRRREPRPSSPGVEAGDAPPPAARTPRAPEANRERPVFRPAPESRSEPRPAPPPRAERPAPPPRAERPAPPAASSSKRDSGELGID
jgi:hypothetical protein